MRNLVLASCLAALAGCSLVTVEQQPFAPLRVTGKRPPPPPARVVLTESSIQIGEKVQFGFDSADILPASHGLLNEVAQVLRDNPQIELVQIEGHTDNTGKANYNRDLSRRRAESVKKFLSDAGIDKKRLDAKGFGPDRPLSSNDSDAGKEQNRRVEFNIVKQGPKKTIVTEE